VTGGRSANVEEGRMSDQARVVGAIALTGCLIVLSGCDWWPPALQQRIGELEANVQAAEAEKSALLKKVAEVSQAAEDCKAQSDQMAKAQVDLQARVDQLQAALADAQDKLKSKDKPVRSKSKSKK
jgi:predicted  nucleic acid-binding Zn-ribbon protein